MNVTFHHPPALNAAGAPSANPFVDFDPQNQLHYPNTAGIYIYGLRLTVNGVRKFVPQYIGTAKNLKTRLHGNHWKQSSMPGNKSSLKEIFDYSLPNFTLLDIENRYQDKLIYDSVPSGASKVSNRLIYALNSLIWYQDMNFYNLRLGILPCFFGNSNHRDTIIPGGIFDGVIATPMSVPIILQINDLRRAIIETKQKYNDDFYFVYATFEDIKINADHMILLNYPNYGHAWNRDTENLLKRIELTTKMALSKLNIHTTAKADGAVYPMDINLSVIQNCLININGHSFNTSSGIYWNHLTIPMP